MSLKQKDQVPPALVSPLTKYGRKLPRASTGTLVATVALIPAWAVTVLPLSLGYQVVQKLLSSFGSAKPSPSPTLDSGYVVDTIVPRSKRKYDIVVLGATGFTGGLAARHLAQTYTTKGAVCSWAIAGRSQGKLDAVKKKIAAELDLPEILDIDTIVVDTAIPATLPKLVEQTRVVATTAGPYSLYGSSVVEFCAKFGTHYVDITGEVDWVQAMLVQWQETAKKSGAKLVSFCGHDSIPWDLSVMKLQQELRDQCQDDLVTATFWDEAKGGAPGGTLATMFTFIEGKGAQAPKCDFDPFLRRPDGSKSAHIAKADLPSFIEKCQSPWETESVHRYTVPFVMAAVNSKVACWSYALRDTGSPTLVYRESLVCPDLKTAVCNYAGMAMFGSMLLNPITASLLKHYVLPKPGEGPSMKDMEEKHYLCVLGQGIGKSGNTVESTFYFPQDPGCLETAKMLVESGLALALQEDELPIQQGGFWTPASGLGNVLMQRLLQTGAQFESRVIPAEKQRAKL